MRIHIVAFYKTQLGFTIVAGIPNGVTVTAGMTIRNSSNHVWKITSRSFKEMPGLNAGLETKRKEGFIYKGYTIEPADFTIINLQPVGDYFMDDVWHLAGM